MRDPWMGPIMLLVSMLLTPCLGVEYKLAWLAPESTYLDTRAGSTVGALQKAITTVESSILSSDTLTVTWQDTDCDGRQAINAAYNILVVDGYDPDIILGPPCTSSMTYVGEYAGYNNLPIFGWLSDDSAFEDKSNYNSLVRAYGPINAIADSLILMLKEFHWARVELISSDSYSSLGQGVYDALEADSYFNVVRWLEVDDNTKTKKIKKYYETLKLEARIVIFAVPQNKFRKWMLAAHDEEMVAGDYVFLYLNSEIPSEAVEDEWLSKRSWRSGDGRNQDALQAFQNVLVLIQNLDFVGSVNTFLEQADDAAVTSSLPTDLSITTASSDVTSPFLHDAVLLWASLVSELGSSSNGSALLQQARNRAFTGSEWATGDIYLDEFGDRKPEFWLLDVNGRDKFHKALETQLALVEGVLTTCVDVVKDVRWGNGTRGIRNAPPDVPLCGWRNEKCPDLVLYITPPAAVILLIIIAIVIFFIVRKYRFEKSLENMTWIIAREDLKFKEDQKGMGSAFMRMSHASLRHSRLSHVGHGKDKADSTSRSTEGDHEQMFIRTAHHKKSVVAVRNVRKDRVKIDRAILVEMRQMTDMKHANVAQFVGAVVEPPELMVIWEYCTKGGLQDVIWNENIRLDSMFKFSLVVDILKGLKYIHRSPFRHHGKLRSSSCVVDSRWTCKITDYGLTNFCRGQSEDTDVSNFKKISRLFWVAPEHLQNVDVDDVPDDVRGSQPGDVYAAAIIIKEIFARNGPYTEYDDDYTPEEIIEKVKKCDGPQPFRPNLRESRDKMPDKIIDTLKRGWAESPEERQSASSFLRDIQRSNPSKSASVVDNMIKMMERYSTNLEGLVTERTQEVHEEKRRSDNLLYKMLPKSVAEDLRVGKSVAPEAFEAVSIYFSDIVSFTKLAAQSTPMQVVAMLNELYTKFDSITEEHDVYKVETIGDAYMYVSGLPLKNGDNHAVEVTNCAMDLLSTCMAFKVAHLENYVLRIRIGLHTGPVVAGVVGITMPRYCLFGDSVTTASKMESGGEPMRIHMSETTFKYLSKFAGYHLSDRGPMEVKGKGSLRTYFLVSRDGYDKSYPSYDELAADDNPAPKKLPVTKGRVQRSSAPNRPSTESGFYESDLDKTPIGTPRKLSSVQPEMDKKLSNIDEKIVPQSAASETVSDTTGSNDNSPKKVSEEKEAEEDYANEAFEKDSETQSVKTNSPAKQNDKPPPANPLAWRREESILEMTSSQTTTAQRKQPAIQLPHTIADVTMDDLEEDC